MGDSTLLQECGVETVLFLHYLRSLFLLFGLLTVLVTPSIASFNYLAAGHPASTDWLNMLSWSNLPTKDARSYWLYAMLVPLMVAFMLYNFTRHITRATELRREALSTMDQRTRRQRRFFVVLANATRHWDADAVQHCCSRWKDRVDYIRHIPASWGCRSARLAELIQLIEQRETSFIARMIRQSRTLDDRSFQHLLLTCLRKRYSGDESRRWGWSGNHLASMPMLYHRLRKLVSSMSDETGESQSLNQPGSILMALTDYRWARVLTDMPVRGDHSRHHARFLGSNAADIIAANLGQDGSWTDWRRSLAQTLTFALALLWTFPMAMVGGLSQISVVIQLVPGLSGQWWPSWLLGVVQGVVPSLATSVLMWTFPRLLQVIMEQAGYSTHTDVQLATQSVYFAFLFVQLFLNPSVASGLIPIVFEVLNNGITEVPRILAQNLPLAGNYYLSYLLVQAILLVVSVLLRPMALIGLWRATRGTSSPRAKVAILWTLLVPIKWGELYPFYSVLAVIGK